MLRQSDNRTEQFAYYRGRRKGERSPEFHATTWIVGVRELVRDPSPAEQKRIDRSTADLNKRRRSANDDYDWIRWPKDNKFADECREGDTIISIWSPRRKGRRYVTRGLPVLLKRNEPQFCRFYLGAPVEDSDMIGWTAFQRVLSAANYDKYVGPNSVQALSPEMADAIDRRWKRATRKQV